MLVQPQFGPQAHSGAAAALQTQSQPAPGQGLQGQSIFASWGSFDSEEVGFNVHSDQFVRAATVRRRLAALESRRTGRAVVRAFRVDARFGISPVMLVKE